MDIQFAKSLLAVLADGINPFTGEPLSEGDACNNPDMSLTGWMLRRN